MTYTLRPFSTREDLTLTCEMVRENDSLTLVFEFSGSVEFIKFPPLTDEGSRQHELWKSTCFELFLAKPGDEGYYEFNFSPKGDWNIYHLEAYRRGLTEEMDVEMPLIKPVQNGRRITIDLSNLGLPAGTTEVSITAVVEMLDGETLYWAIAHCGPEPDFHRRDSFVLVV